MEGLVLNRLAYLNDIWKLRYFLLSLVKNDLNNRYKRSFLGIGWSLLRPLAMTFIFCMVFGKVFDYPIAEYVPYLLIGMTTWQFFTESLVQGCNSFVLGSAYIRQQKVPLAIFPLRCVLGSGFHALIALGVGLGLILYFRGFPDPLALFYLLPAMVLLFFLGWFLAIISGVMHTHFPDTSNLLEICLQILFYLSPILYKPESIQSRIRFFALVEWNPISSILALVRTPLLEGTAPSNHHLLISLCFVSMMGIIASLLLRKLERNMIFWI